MKNTNSKKRAHKIEIIGALTVLVAPLIINVGLIVTDIICKRMGVTLTAIGLDNTHWLDFWKQYLAIIISFAGILMVYISSKKDRENNMYEKNAQQYMEEVRREESVLVEVIQQFNTGVLCDSLLTQSQLSLFEGCKILTDTRDKLNCAHVEFELLTELCDDFRKCENCPKSPCNDKILMKDLRDLFYDTEKRYYDMLSLGEQYLELLNKEQKRIELLEIEKRLYNNTNQLVVLNKSQGLENVEELLDEAKQIKERLIELEESKMKDEENQKWLVKIRNEIEYIDNEARPKLIKYSKLYVNEKKKHAKELREKGSIQYIKADSYK